MPSACRQYRSAGIGPRGRDARHAGADFTRCDVRCFSCQPHDSPRRRLLGTPCKPGRLGFTWRVHSGRCRMAWHLGADRRRRLPSSACQAALPRRCRRFAQGCSVTAASENHAAWWRFSATPVGAARLGLSSRKRLLRPLNHSMRHIARPALSLFATPGFASGISGEFHAAFCLSGRCTGWIESCVAQLRTLLLFPPQCLIAVLSPTLV